MLVRVPVSRTCRWSSSARRQRQGVGRGWRPATRARRRREQL